MFFSSFLAILWAYNMKFKVYHVMIGDKYMLQNIYHNKVS